MLRALIDAVGSLAYRLTGGDTFVMCLKREDGTIAHAYPSSGTITWIRAEEDAPDPSGALPPRLCAFHHLPEPRPAAPSRCQDRKARASDQVLATDQHPIPLRSDRSIQHS